MCVQIKQIDILIYKNQAMKILYLKHHAYKTSWIWNVLYIATNKMHENFKN